ncbi:DUF2177 family protein [Chelativorans intermedius]|uniref:DUF2177 family protein n=1 Tax=Chelativorans intermedius TaxID=515947 RepID=A0ABV6D2S2_9HYPH|nr:DUF2177 family protein [Chelativorans intermedius]MCT8997239.1 DUF2177 family protein [Chelativorans intermedius]
MKLYATAYLATGLIFLAVDAIWLWVMNRVLYQPTIGPLLLDGFKPVPAALFYMIYIFGIVFFAVAPALALERWTTALIHGAIFGFVAYATYDLTNHATLKGWSAVVTMADLAWGTVLTSTAALSGYLVTQALSKGAGG